ARVIAADIDLKKAEETVAEIKKSGGKATAHHVDVTQFKEVENFVKQVVKEYGSIDVMVNNAGIGGKNQNKTAEHTLEDWHSVIAVNQTGVFYCMKVALQQMLLQGEGNIINIASLAGLKPSGNNLSYSASKFAVVGMTKSAALEYGRKNIRINAVCPGYTHSSLLDQLLASRPDMGERLKQMIPMGRFGEATEVAETVAWLASDSSKYITGQTITIDGGTSLH
ncbi:MAG: SDR family oxidoreductase, partial [Muriicola sp.]